MTSQTRHNWLILVPLVLLSAICAVAGMFLLSWLVEDVIGFRQLRSETYFLIGGLGGYRLTHPLWLRYRRR